MVVLEIACRSRPDLEAIPTYGALPGHAAGDPPRLTWPFGRSRAVISIEDPVLASGNNLPDLLAEAAPGAAWLVRIRAPLHDPGMVRLARAIARNVAQVHDGAAYDASTRRLLWPRRTRAVAPLSDFPDTEDAVRMMRRQGQSADGQLSALESLVSARRADGRRFLQELAAAGGTRAAVWALSCGAQVLREEFADVLADYLSDHRLHVWDCALSDLQELAPGRIVPHLPALREKLRRAHPDHEAAVHLLWLFAQMYDQPAHAAVARFRDRSAPGRPFQHRLAAVVADYLRTGPKGVYRYLLDLEEVYLCAAAQVASRLGTTDALAALRFAARSAPEGACRDQCGELADKMAHALETLTPPFWRGFTQTSI